MRIITGSKMKRLDLWAEKERKIPSLLLMENAGRSVALKIQELFPEKEQRQGNYLFLIGKGNNGGDALVAARHLYQQGFGVKLFFLFPLDNLQGIVLKNWQLLEELGVKGHYLADEHSFYLFKLSLNNCSLVIDGIFGTGFRDKLPANIERTIDIVNNSSCPVLAIDVPSGVDADFGYVSNKCICADYTVTFAWSKRGLVLYPAKKFVGQLYIADISFPKDALALLDNAEYYVDADFAGKLLPERDEEGHKNTFGHAVVIAGSAGMMGAAYLAGKGVLRSGAGMVTACVPESTANTFDLALPEALTLGVEETKKGSLSAAGWSAIQRILPGKKVIIFGPGLGTDEQIQKLLQTVLQVEIPVVLDADGLNVLAQDVSVLKMAKAPLILTPHPGEMARLLETTVESVQKNRVQMAIQAAVNFNAVVVLKGAATVIATPDKQVFINSTGNSALATAGSGDVLAGAIGGFIAQGLAAVDAAILGVYIHGLAGEILAKEKGLRGVLAGDVVEALPLALKTLEGLV
ncbi:MAG: NAD(P)H-hydrate dehydratase [Clostridia bacterium]|jgi:hydroxyethylthiazole kinase-like uncharacterized protein yjeF|nr:NAD(P)H-hydrate dehydratase [Clostridia bacterium]